MIADHAADTTDCTAATADDTTDRIAAHAELITPVIAAHAADAAPLITAHAAPIAAVTVVMTDRTPFANVFNAGCTAFVHSMSANVSRIATAHRHGRVIASNT